MVSNKDTITLLNGISKNTLLAALDIQFTEATDESLIASMPVNHNVHQPFGLLHGGASVALAESVGSSLSNMHLDFNTQYAVGMEIAAHHLKSVRKGMVFAKATFIKKGKTTHVIDIAIRNELGDLICHATMTNMIMTKKL